MSWDFTLKTWLLIASILPKRLELVDNSRRKHHVGGKVNAIDHREVLDMMQCYDVPLVNNQNPIDSLEN